jgi:uncharacterized membrane protein YgdD (TMEM256/DUF423 family)
MNWILLITAINGFLVVMLGAFGAHGLEDILTPAHMATWQTGVQYHMFHTVTLFGTGLLCRAEPENRLVSRSATLFLAGIVLFSGSLYLLAVTGISMLGFITPLGGVAFLGGWGCLGYAVFKGLSRD